MSRYLITGGAGFIGSHLAKKLLSLGHDIVILDNLSTGKKSNINPKCEFIEGCITDDKKLNTALSLKGNITLYFFNSIKNLISPFEMDSIERFLIRFNIKSFKIILYSP